ncbi:MAG: AzlC family ABC transporter permease [Rubellimicrobium sp.]|nr:AzlC family ABC transporter permease [Rubellimicrobium sp.]
MTPNPGFRAGALAAVPIMLGYFPMAVVFGVEASRVGLSTLQAGMLSVIMFAGAAQFLALALIASGAAPLVAAGTLIAINLRHILYGPALMKAAGQPKRRWAALWSWCLTDEVFAQALATFRTGQRFSEGWITGLGLCAYAAWVGGSVVGAWAGEELLTAWPALEAGLGFIVPALFLALLMSVASRESLPAVAVALVATVLGALVFDATGAILSGMIAGALAGVLIR